MTARPSPLDACDACLRRTALVARLAPHIERARHERRRLGELLALDDERLIAAVAGRGRAEIACEHEAFAAGPARQRLAAAGLQALCRHDERYPVRLRASDDAAAVLHVAGDPAVLLALARPGEPAVAVVGARRAGEDSLEVARLLGRGLASAGVTVVSGMALGVDSAAHAGALEAGGPTIAVLAGGADAPYPTSKARLYRAIVATQCAISEMPPSFVPRKWCFPARNRTIAALADVTIVVEAAERSGSLITAELAQDLGRTVGAVPGRVMVPRWAGSNALLRDGAVVIRHAQDALDEVLGIGVATAPAGPSAAALDPALRALLARVQDGRDTVAALASTPAEAEEVLAGLAELELLGLLRRGAGGRYVPAG
jgi:DNA processing protein